MVDPPAAADQGTDEEKRDFLETSFAFADTNKDGRVDKDEFIVFYSALLDAQELEEKARAAFDEYDIDVRRRGPATATPPRATQPAPSAPACPL